jgi:Cu-Zn family superoxide dismutase
MVTTEALATYALPGDAVFPESIGVDPATGDAYVGSLADGTLYRLAAGGEVTVVSAAGAGGRASVAGVKVDSHGRLWVAGGYGGTLDVYRLADLSLLHRFDVGGRPSCVNDVAFGPAGEAYVTDSFISVLFRVAGDPLALAPWVDLAEQGVPWSDGLNLNGIVLTEDERHLVTCQTNLGRFWRIALDTGHVDEVALDGGPLEHCDGLARVGLPGRTPVGVDLDDLAGHPGARQRDRGRHAPRTPTDDQSSADHGGRLRTCVV